VSAARGARGGPRVRLGLLADPHGDAAATAFALDLLRGAGADADALVCLGDVVSEQRFSAETCDLLRAAGARCVQGNHDAAVVARDGRSVDQARVWLAALPEVIELERAGRQVIACHGSPEDPRRYLYPGTAELAAAGALGDAVLLTGHTHMPMCELVGETLVVNPGSCSETRSPCSRDVLTCATVDLPDGVVTLLGFRRVAGQAGFVALDEPVAFDAFAW
jgi:putative phosphoesterase